MKRKNYSFWVYASLPFLFIIGSFLHFSYALSGNNIIVGLFSAVNESVFEHMKMVILPLLLFWIIYDVIQHKKQGLDQKRWFSAMLGAIGISFLTMPILFYFYRDGLGIESVIIDILLYLIVLVIGQWFGLHLYRYTKGIPVWLSTSLLVVFLALVVMGTLTPPHLPLFQDHNTKQYGIGEQ